MIDEGASVALGTLLATDLTVADHAELATAAAAAARVQAFVDLAKVQINRRTRQLADGGDRSADHVLLDEGRLTGKDARSTDERDRVCASLPELEDALASGACTGAHLDALARHTKDLTDAERSDLGAVVSDLVDHATSEPAGLFDRTARDIVDRIRAMHRPDADVDELERQRAASKVTRWTDRDTGLKHTMIALDPLRDASLWTAIDHQLARLRADAANGQRPFAELQVAALMATIGSGADTNGRPATGRVPEVMLHVDLTTATHGRHEHTICETVDGVRVPVPTSQRLCCDAVVQAVIVRPDGTVDRLCAERRSASRQQRRMLAAMYRRCAHPHCDVGFSACRIHHVEWFSRGGATVIANLLPLCERHHHLVHEGRWSLSIAEDRRVTWLRPDGSVWLTDDGPNRTSRARARGPSPPARSAGSTAA